MRRIADGEWQAGRAIPSEMQIAAELGVSQGTVRKALDEMTAERLLVRRRASAPSWRATTRTASSSSSSSLAATTAARLPDSTVLSVAEQPSDAAEATRLGIRRGTRRANPPPAIARRRHRGERAHRRALCALCRARRLRSRAEQSLRLYAERYASPSQGQREPEGHRLPRGGCRPSRPSAGSPVLAIDRLALDLDGQKVEWRVSLCRTDQFHYTSDLK